MVPLTAHPCTGRGARAGSLPWLLLPAALAALALLATPGPTVAQTERPVPRPDPLNPRAAVPPLVHGSALASYRRLAEVPVGSWREANDQVARIGGWRAYAREANEPQVPAAAPAAAASTPPARLPGHVGHRDPPAK